jgi:hypothetical protein
VKVIVRPGIQAVHNGNVYRPGEIADIPQHIAYGWFGSGCAVEAADQSANRD